MNHTDEELVSWSEAVSDVINKAAHNAAGKPYAQCTDTERFSALSLVTIGYLQVTKRLIESHNKIMLLLDAGDRIPKTGGAEERAAWAQINSGIRAAIDEMVKL